MGDSFVIATAEQVTEMTKEVWAVFEKYRRVGQGNPNARRVAVYLVGYPLDLDRVPRGGQDR